MIFIVAIQVAVLYYNVISYLYIFLTEVSIMDKKSFRIGTLTFHKSLNYGSFLQAYALQKKLLQLGYDTEIIDYEPKGFREVYSDFLFPTSLWSLSYDYVHLVLWKYIKSRRESFAKASQKLLRLSSKKYNYQTGLSGVEKEYDAIICGSDQIWNANARDFDMNFMLHGVQHPRKIAYAVSINTGKYSNNPNKDIIKACLSDFTTISTRETDGKEHLDAFLNGAKNVDVMIDPTFLIPSQDYDLLIGERRVKEPYIFLFSIHFKDHVCAAARELSKKLHLPVYTLFSGRGRINSIKTQKEFHMLHGDVGPDCFLNLVKHADYVVVDSFHGTAFSIIYRKQFLAVYDEQKDIRLNHILSLMDLDKRYIRPSEVLNFDTAQKVDFTIAEQVLSEQTARADKFLKCIGEDRE